MISPADGRRRLHLRGDAACLAEPLGLDAVAVELERLAAVGAVRADALGPPVRAASGGIGREAAVEAPRRIGELDRRLAAAGARV
jgi:hypothetical protein